MLSLSLTQVDDLRRAEKVFAKRHGRNVLFPYPNFAGSPIRCHGPTRAAGLDAIRGSEAFASTDSMRTTPPGRFVG